MTIMHVDKIIRKDGKPYRQGKGKRGAWKIELFEGTYDEGKTGTFKTFYNIETDTCYEGVIVKNPEYPNAVPDFKVESVFTDEPKTEKPKDEPKPTAVSGYAQTTPDNVEYTQIPSDKPTLDIDLDGLFHAIVPLVAWKCAIDYYNTFTNAVTFEQIHKLKEQIKADLEKDWDTRFGKK